MVWGGVSSNHQTPLVVVERTWSVAHQQDFSPNIALPCFDHWNDVAIFQHDNAEPHITRISQHTSSMTMMCI